MPELIVDDMPITDDQGDIFELDEDFDGSGVSRYVSDIHNPKGKPQSRAREAPRSQRAAFPGGGGGAAQVQGKMYSNPTPLPSGRVSPPADDYLDDDKGPRLLTESPYGYHPRVSGYRPVATPQAPYWSQQAQQGPGTGSFGRMPHPHQASIQRQLESAGYRGYGGGHAAAPASYHAAPPPYYSGPGTVSYAIPAAPSYGGYGYGAPMYGPGYGIGGYGGYGY